MKGRGGAGTVRTTHLLHRPTTKQLAQARIQVKSRYATDCNRGFPIKAAALDAFDFLVVAFLNIGRFYGKHDGLTGERDAEFFPLTPQFVKDHHHTTSSWEKVLLAGLDTELKPFAGGTGFELIASALGVPRPRRTAKAASGTTA